MTGPCHRPETLSPTNGQSVVDMIASHDGVLIFVPHTSQKKHVYHLIYLYIIIYIYIVHTTI